MTWGKALPAADDEVSCSNIDRKGMLKKEKLKHMQGLLNSQNDTSNHKKQDNKEMEDGLGLTQVEKPRGIFD